MLEERFSLKKTCYSKDRLLMTSEYKGPGVTYEFTLHELIPAWQRQKDSSLQSLYSIPSAGTDMYHFQE